MKLIGMLDSPYVRRVAISLTVLGIPFEHEAVSVFSTFERFKSINPVVKAPTLVCDDGELLMDSSLILEFIEATLPPGAVSLWPSDRNELQHDFRAVSLALAACEKGVQIVYERNLRPKQAQYEPWVERVTGQALAAFGALEREVVNRPAAFAQSRSQAAITTAVIWQFAQSMLASLLPASDYPALTALSKRMEQTPAFKRFPPDGPGV